MENSELIVLIVMCVSVSQSQYTGRISPVSQKRRYFCHNTTHIVVGKRNVSLLKGSVLSVMGGAGLGS